MHPPIFAYHPELLVYWGESVVISPGLARFLRYEGLDSGPSPDPDLAQRPTTPNLQQAASLQNLCHGGILRHSHWCLRSTSKTAAVQFKGILETEKAAEVVNNLSFEGEKGLAVMISGGR
jgi:hypothetical protein